MSPPKSQEMTGRKTLSGTNKTGENIHWRPIRTHTYQGKSDMNGFEMTMRVTVTTEHALGKI